MVEDSGADRGGVAAVAWELTGAMTAWQPLRCGRRRCGGSVSSSRAQRCSGPAQRGGEVMSCAIHDGRGRRRIGEVAAAYWSGHQDLGVDKMNGRGVRL
jgi:hypothetical protein